MSLPNKITIRSARLEDLDAILTLLKEFAGFFGTKKSLFGELSHSKQIISNMITSHLFFVAEKSSAVIGLISGWVHEHPYNPEIKVLTETFWWVDPIHRNSRAGLLLLNAFTDWGKKNADWISFTLEDKSPVSDRCLVSRGYKTKERSFLLEVN